MSSSVFPSLSVCQHLFASSALYYTLASERARPPGSCANTVWVIQRCLDVAHQCIGPEQTCSFFLRCGCQMINWPVRPLTVWCVRQPFTRLILPVLVKESSCLNSSTGPVSSCRGGPSVVAAFNVLWSAIWPDVSPHHSLSLSLRSSAVHKSQKCLRAWAYLSASLVTPRLEGWS